MKMVETVIEYNTS